MTGKKLVSMPQNNMIFNLRKLRTFLNTVSLPYFWLKLNYVTKTFPENLNWW